MALTDRTVTNNIVFSESGVPVLIDNNGFSLIAGPEHIAGSNNISAGNVYGYVTVNSTNLTAIRNTNYTEPTSAGRMEFLSNNANDSAGGTGVKSIKIIYLDGYMDGPFTEIVTLNGTTPVGTTAVNIKYVQRLEAVTVGSNGSNVGTITLRGFGGGSVVGTIAVGDGVTHWSHHYIAAGKKCFIKRLILGASTNAGIINLKSVNLLTSNCFEEQLTPSFRVVGSHPSQIYDLEHYVVMGGSRITGYVKADGNGSTIYYCGFSYYEF